MNSLAMHRVIIGVLIVALGVVVVLDRTSGHDGNPSGLDVIYQKQGVSASLQGDLTKMACLTNAKQPCTNVLVELHFMQNSPAPQCPSDPTNLQLCPGGPSAPRALPTCDPTTQICLTINTAPIALPTPFEEFSQDTDGLHDGEDIGAQYIVIMKPASSPGKGP